MVLDVPLPPGSRGELNCLRRAAGFRSLGELVADALALYAELASRVELGGTITITAPDGTEEEVRMGGREGSR